MEFRSLLLVWCGISFIGYRGSKMADDENFNDLAKFEFDENGLAKISRSNLIALIGAVTRSTTLTVTAATLAISVASEDDPAHRKELMADVRDQARSLTKLIDALVEAIPKGANNAESD